MKNSDYLKQSDFYRSGCGRIRFLIGVGGQGGAGLSAGL